MIDNHPKRRQNNKRNHKKSKNGDLILIVCEATETEPNYFKAIKKEYKLQNITVKSSDGSTPLPTVEYAYKLATQGNSHEGIEANRFDKIFVVFDRDEHEDYHPALKKAEEYRESLSNKKKKKMTFEVIISVPCFELWVLLHFKEIFAFIHRNDVWQDLQQQWKQTFGKEYEKNTENNFKDTKHNIPAAKVRANTLMEKYHYQNGTDPYTNVGELVDFLQNQKTSQT